MQSEVPATTRCSLKYVVKGIETSRETRLDLQRELQDNLEKLSSLTVLPVVQGISVEIDMHDVAPFTADSFEPYVAEHVLPEAVAIQCKAALPIELELIKARYY